MTAVMRGETFTEYLNRVRPNLRYFRPSEFMFLGSSHSNPNHQGYRKNHEPPSQIWPNILKTADVIDEIRHRLMKPINITCAYRSPAYNAAVGGGERSQHKQFRAVDFVSSRATGEELYRVAMDLRQSGFFVGGIGRYSTFCHVDTRNRNANWRGS